jgi:hypothetical protein
MQELTYTRSLFEQLGTSVFVLGVGVLMIVTSVLLFFRREYKKYRLWLVLFGLFFAVITPVVAQNTIQAVLLPMQSITGQIEDKYVQDFRRSDFFTIAVANSNRETFDLVKPIYDQLNIGDCVYVEYRYGNRVASLKRLSPAECQ